MSTLSPLKNARLRRRLTLQHVAAAVAVDTGNLSRIERGTQVPSKRLAERLAKFFDGAVTETQIIFPERFPIPTAEDEDAGKAEASGKGAPHA